MRKLSLLQVNSFTRTLVHRKPHRRCANHDFASLVVHTSFDSGKEGVYCPRTLLTQKCRIDRILNYSNVRSKSSLATVYESDEQPATDTTLLPMSKPFILTDIGEGIHEVELLQWYVHAGDSIEQFQKVCEVQSDKATVEITSRYDGTIEKLCGAQGDMVEVGSPLMFISPASHDVLENDTDFGKSECVAVDTSSVAAGVDIASANDNKSLILPKTDNGRKIKVFASPAVRRLSMENSLDLSSIHGSGKFGRVLKGDIIEMLKGHSIPAENLRDDTFLISNKSHPKDSVHDEVISIQGYNRAMVHAMETTLQVPHMVYSDEVDMSALRQCREDIKEMAERKGVTISYLPFAVKACSLALTECPILNSSIDTVDMTLTLHANHHIGVAIDSPKGLVVPVLRNCQDMSVLDIAVEMKRLRELADQGALTEDDLKGPTFTISNIGSIGGTVMSPVVLPPQVAIGAMGKIQRLPRYVGDTKDIEEVYLMNISWGGDHRVLDGGTLGRFSNVWKSYIEKPMIMALTMK